MTQSPRVCFSTSKLIPTFTTCNPLREKRSGYCFRLIWPWPLPQTYPAQFNDIQLTGNTHHHIHTPLGGTHLHIDIHPEQGEDDVEQLLVMSLIIRVITIRNSRKEFLKKTQGPRPYLPRLSQDTYGRWSYCLSACYGPDSQAASCASADPYLTVRNVQRIQFGQLVVILYRKVTALIEQRNNALHFLRRRIEISSHSLHTSP